MGIKKSTLVHAVPVLQKNDINFCRKKSYTSTKKVSMRGRSEAPVLHNEKRLSFTFDNGVRTCSPQGMTESGEVVRCSGKAGAHAPRCVRCLPHLGLWKKD